MIDENTEPRDIDESPTPQKRRLAQRGGGMRRATTAKQPVVEWLDRHPRLLQTVIWTIVIGSVVTGGVLFFTDRLNVEDAGYTGAFVVNLIGSASVVIPVPGLAAVCGAAAPSVGLNILALGFVGGVGATIGELTGYLAGFGGHSFVQRSRHYNRVRRLVIRRGALALFLLAALPTPFFDVAGIAAGSLVYPVKRFLLWVFLGKIIKFIGIAYACHESIDWFTNLLSL